MGREIYYMIFSKAIEEYEDKISSCEDNTEKCKARREFAMDLVEKMEEFLEQILDYDI
jgi:hypothetical protein